MNYKIEVGEESAAGAREENQDRLAHFESPFGFVAMVADGMGGHQGGSVASSLAVARFPELLRQIPETQPPDEALVQSIEELNREIQAQGETGSVQEGMGSTLAAVLVRENEAGPLAITAHVGDSRVYFLRGERLFCLTRDHTLVQDLVESGALTAEQASDHPRAHVLTRALGHGEPLSVDVSSWMLLADGDVFLLCSDGLSAYVSDEAIRDALVTRAPAGVLARGLVQTALEQGSTDNISAAVVRIAAGEPGSE